MYKVCHVMHLDLYASNYKDLSTHRQADELRSKPLENL